jgi:hypothetical protein
MWSSGGMILTGEDGRSKRKTCPSVALSVTNPTRDDPGTNLHGWFASNRGATRSLNVKLVFK